MKNDIKLYPPTGGEGVIPHPSKIEEMKKKGWVEKPVIVKQKSEGKSNGKS